MRLLMATVERQFEEAEPVTIKFFGDEVTLVFPDEQITFKTEDLMEHLMPATEQREAA